MGISSENADYANNEKVKNLATSGTVTLYAVWESNVTLTINRYGHTEYGMDKVRVYSDETNYKQYTSLTKIPVNPGQKVVFLHNSNRSWGTYYDKHEAYIQLGNDVDGPSASIYVPENASGHAEMSLYCGNYDYGDDFFANESGYNGNSGWILNVAPTYGEDPAPAFINITDPAHNYKLDSHNTWQSITYYVKVVHDSKTYTYHAHGRFFGYDNEYDAGYIPVFPGDKVSTPYISFTVPNNAKGGADIKLSNMGDGDSCTSWMQGVSITKSSSSSHH